MIIKDRKLDKNHPNTNEFKLHAALIGKITNKMSETV